MKRLNLARPRRNRSSAAIRALVRETQLTPDCFILPIFVCDGKGVEDPITAMPGQHRYSVDRLAKRAKAAKAAGIPAIALFPKVDDALKDARARESVNKNGLVPKAIQAIKDAAPDLLVITDVAMDPYSSDGHDGLVAASGPKRGRILNDETLEILAAMALVQVEAGADWIAPSDMMDGRVGYLRRQLDEHGHIETGILAYTAKYASAFYGPFREALDSAPRGGDKKTYQMDPANSREAIREAKLDVAEGADIVMVKPALAYLDVIAALRRTVDVPVAAYQVSGEYSMIMAAAKNGWMDEKAAMLEALTAIRRAGASMILSYYALEAAQFTHS